MENGFVRIKLLSLKQLHLFLVPLKIAARANTPRLLGLVFVMFMSDFEIEAWILIVLENNVTNCKIYCDIVVYILYMWSGKGGSGGDASYALRGLP